MSLHKTCDICEYNGPDVGEHRCAFAHEAVRPHDCPHKLLCPNCITKVEDFVEQAYTYEVAYVENEDEDMTNVPDYFDGKPVSAEKTEFFVCADCFPLHFPGDDEFLVPVCAECGGVGPEGAVPRRNACDPMRAGWTGSCHLYEELLKRNLVAYSGDVLNEAGVDPFTDFGEATVFGLDGEEAHVLCPKCAQDKFHLPGPYALTRCYTDVMDFLDEVSRGRVPGRKLTEEQRKRLFDHFVAKAEEVCARHTKDKQSLGFGGIVGPIMATAIPRRLYKKEWVEKAVSDCVVKLVKRAVRLYRKRKRANAVCDAAAAALRALDELLPVKKARTATKVE